MDNEFTDVLSAGLEKRKVVVIKVDVFFHNDSRRQLNDVTLPGPLPFPVVQMKSLDFHSDGVEEGRPVGNHYHSEKSGRIEFFVAVGGKGDLFQFFWKDPGSEEVKEQTMKCGDACLIPVGTSHSFIPLQEGCQIWGFSNTPHDPANDLSDEIVPVPK